LKLSTCLTGKSYSRCFRYSSADWNKFIAQDRDLCQPLDGQAVCRSLNSSARICAPTGWAGEVIRRALNRTQSALSSLFESIELKLRRRATHEAAHRQRAQSTDSRNQTQRSRQPRQAREEHLTGAVDAVQLCAELVFVVLPAVAAVLVSRAAYTSYHDYVVDVQRRSTLSDQLYCLMAVQGHARSSISVPIESAHATFD